MSEPTRQQADRTQGAYPQGHTKALLRNTTPSSPEGIYSYRYAPGRPMAMPRRSGRDGWGANTATDGGAAPKCMHGVSLATSGMTDGENDPRKVQLREWRQRRAQRLAGAVARASRAHFTVAAQARHSPRPVFAHSPYDSARRPRARKKGLGMYCRTRVRVCVCRVGRVRGRRRQRRGFGCLPRDSVVSGTHTRMCNPTRSGLNSPAPQRPTTSQGAYFLSRSSSAPSKWI